MIPITQYIRPDGHTREIEISRPPEIEARANELIRRGLRFEAEVLVTGEVSLTISDPEAEEDIAIEITPNGYINEAFDRLLGQVP